MEGSKLNERKGSSLILEGSRMGHLLWRGRVSNGDDGVCGGAILILSLFIHSKVPAFCIFTNLINTEKDQETLNRHRYCLNRALFCTFVSAVCLLNNGVDITFRTNTWVGLSVLYNQFEYFYPSFSLLPSSSLQHPQCLILITKHINI